MKKLFAILCISAISLALLWVNRFAFIDSYIYKKPAQIVSTEIDQALQQSNTVATATSKLEEAIEKRQCVLIDDFNDDSELRWGTVNDGVMGGLSQGSAAIVNQTLIHRGTINTNGGGFSYVGTRLPEDILDGYTGLLIRVNTNGRQYAINFNDSRYWRVSHQVPIPVGEDSLWQEVFIEFSDTVPTIFW